LEESVLVWLSLFITNLGVDIIDVQLVGVKRCFIRDSDHEFLDLALDVITTSSSGAVSWLNFLENAEEL
jgi:hypothetical protein